MDSPDFWRALDELVARSRLVIDRPKGSAHPRYPDQTYPFDYGYLEGTTSGDAEGIDIWVGSLPGREVTGAILAVDLLKGDCEAKILLGCTQEEARQIAALHNSGTQSAILLERPEGAPEWLHRGRLLMANAQNGLNYSQNPYDLERYKQIREIAEEMLAAGSGASIEQVRRLYSGEVGHATPKVDVRGVVIEDDAILLVKERADGLWTVPGGWADIGESPGVGAAREVWEESGYRVRPVKLLAAFDRDKHGHPPHEFHIYKLFYLCELEGGEPATSIETDGVGFFREDEIPPLSMGRVTAEEIARFFDQYRHPDWPTDFD